jgi:ribosome biogenesis protein BRX1
MDELQLTGNCLKGSRPILSFGAEFDKEPHLMLVKEMFTHVFGTPKGHPKSKPFVDHVMQFSVMDGRIWFRNYQIVDATKDKKERARAEKLGTEVTQLMEIGPRMVMNLVQVFDAGFGGRPLFKNPHYISPNAMRSQLNRQRGLAYAGRKEAEEKRKERKQENVLPNDPLKRVFQ